MVKLRNLKQNPESLTIELLAKIGIQKLGHLIVLSDCQKGEDVTKR
jgi:hypothetical protein